MTAIQPPSPAGHEAGDETPRWPTPPRPAMHRPGKLRNTLALGALLLPRRSGDAESLYDLITDMFDVVTEGSATINFGFGAPGIPLREAQAELCRQTVRRLAARGEWLDVGCGMGGPACLLAQEHPDVSITGINITRGQVAHASERAGRLGLSGRVRFEVGDACRMPFAGTERFDGIYAIESAFHYPDKAAFAREAARLLKPGGRIGCADIVLRDQMRLTDRMLHRGGRRVLSSPDIYTVRRWTKALAEAGFVEIEVQDISQEVFGLMGEWAQQVEEKRHLLNDRYPGFLLEAILWGLRYLHRHAGNPPLHYVLIEAVRG